MILLVLVKLTAKAGSDGSPPSRRNAAITHGVLGDAEPFRQSYNTAIAVAGNRQESPFLSANFQNQQVSVFTG